MRIRDVLSPCLKAWVLLSVSALGACGGGGSSQPTGNPPPPTEFSVGGTVTGLAGTGLVLQLNGGSDLQQATNGSFTLSPELVSGSTFAVTVKVQPSHPSQTCSVTSGTGTVGQSGVTNVAIACSTNSYKIGGIIGGLQGTGLVLRDADGATIAVAGDGAFTFNQPVQSGASYAVSVGTQPSGPGQACTVTNPSGTVDNADVSDVEVSCVVTHFSSLIVDLAADDEVWDPHTQRLYAAVESSGGTSASIAVINPATGEIETRVATTSAPNPLALSDDGQYLYAGLASSGEIQRYRLPGLVPDIRFGIGQDLTGVPFQAGDIAVQPGHPGTIAVSRIFGNSGGRSGLAIFDDSTRRQSTTGTDRPPGIGGASGALWNSDGSRIFSFEGGAALRSWSFCTYANRVTSIGVFVGDCVQYAGVAAPFGTLYNGPAGCGANCELQINGGRIYSASGVVYDTQANVVVGAYRTAGQSIAVDPDSNKVHFASSAPGSGLTFETFNLSRMALSERNSITEDVGLVRKLVRWGPFGLAAITDGNKLVLTSGTFVSDAAATGISLDGMSLQDGASNIGQHQYRTLAIQANQLAWNAGRHVLYASIPGSDLKYGNSVVAIDINAGAVVSAVPVGSEPSWLSLSDDSAKLWIAHGDTSTVVRVATDSMSKDLEVPIFGYIPGAPTPSSPGFANALAVQPGANSTVAIAAKTANNQWTQVVVVDSSVPRPQSFPFYISSIAWGSPSLLYAATGSLGTWHFYSLQASLTGLTLAVADPPAVAGTPFGAEDGLQYAGGLLYDNLGLAYSPVSMTLVGGVSAGHVNHGGSLFVVDSTRDRAYMTGTNLANTTVLDAYQLSTLALIDSVEFPATVGSPKSLTTLGTQGVAISTADGHVVLVTGGML